MKKKKKKNFFVSREEMFDFSYRRYYREKTTGPTTHTHNIFTFLQRPHKNKKREKKRKERERMMWHHRAGAAGTAAGTPPPAFTRGGAAVAAQKGGGNERGGLRASTSSRKTSDASPMKRSERRAGSINRFLRTSTSSSSSSSSSVICRAEKKRVFIDGEAGTTGLQVRERLEKRSGDVELIQLPDALRKDAKAREEALNEADCTILCLPDAAAMEAVALVTNPNTVVIDASTAYRTNDEWTYGFPELSKEQREKVKTAKRISNPGCYPTGFIGLTKPLVENGFIPKESRITVNAVSGYTGGGKQLIAIYESPEAEPYGAYGFNLNHKHIPEMRKYAGLDHEPIFQPAVGAFAQGMLVSVPLFYDNMANVNNGKQLQECLKEWYKGSTFVSVREYNQTDDLERGAFLRADGLRDTNKLELSVFANDDKGTCLLVARLDNLGKGASGAAVQNLNLSLGLDESVGL